MRITAVSDLHGDKPELPGGDVLIIAGDMTSNDKLVAWHDFFTWLDAQNYKHKICIAGNHDNFCKQWATSGTFTNDEYAQMYPGEKPTLEYLCDSGFEIDGLKIWGSPWSLWFQGINPHCTAFTGMEHDLKEKFSLIPDDVDILVTHTPPWGILDAANNYFSGKTINCGSVSLRYELIERIKPRLHIFGHIHEQGGKTLTFKRPGYGIENNTLCVNASVLDQYYESVNKPFNLEI